MNDLRVGRIYDIWSPVYDLIWGRPVFRRQKDAVRRMRIQPGQRVLDLGVGTGFSLKAWPRDAHVVGVDISEGMLRRAQARLHAAQHKTAHVTLANGLALPFSADTFDHILICHVIAVVSDPIKLLGEVRRVGKPGCRVVIINHFQSGHRWVARLETWLRPVFARLGWVTDVSFEWLAEAACLRVDFRYKPHRFGLSETAFITNQ